MNDDRGSSIGQAMGRSSSSGSSSSERGIFETFFGFFARLFGGICICLLTILVTTKLVALPLIPFAAGAVTGICWFRADFVKKHPFFSLLIAFVGTVLISVQFRLGQ
jgi:hypothetical protein